MSLRKVCAIALALVGLLSVSLSAAQVRVETQVSAATVEVGQQVQVQAKALDEGQAPQNPRLKIPPGFALAGPSIGTSQQISFVNGQVTRRMGLTATWRLTPTKVGEFVIGPASVSTRDGRVSGSSFKLKVVAAGQLPQAPRRRSRSQFDDDDSFPGFGRGGSIFNDLFGRSRLNGRPVEVPPDYQVEAAPDNIAFLRAVVSKSSAVVGEQVNLTVYAYGSRGRFGESNPREPRRPDFFSFSLQESPSRQPEYQVVIAGRRYTAVKLREFALFPLKAGELSIEPMTINFYGNRYASRKFPEGITRTSNALKVQVSEPPVAGRPASYHQGHVGDYRLNAEVSPRVVEQGGTISVVATLTGTGNPPTTLSTPDRKGVEWLPPTIVDNVKPDKRKRIGGARTFTFVVRALEAGNIELGELDVSFWDPVRQRYRTSVARLGRLKVNPTVRGTAPEPATKLKLSEQLAPKIMVSGSHLPARYLSDKLWFWLLVILGPLAILLAQVLSKAALGFVARHRKARASELSLSRAALAEAVKQVASKDTAALGAMERAIFLALEGTVGLKARAVLRAQLSERLVETGVKSELAESVAELLSLLEAARFSGARETLEDLLAQTKHLIQSLRSARA